MAGKGPNLLYSTSIGVSSSPPNIGGLRLPGSTLAKSPPVINTQGVEGSRTPSFAVAIARYVFDEVQMQAIIDLDSSARTNRRVVGRFCHYLQRFLRNSDLGHLRRLDTESAPPLVYSRFVNSGTSKGRFSEVLFVFNDLEHYRAIRDIDEQCQAQSQAMRQVGLIYVTSPGPLPPISSTRYAPPALVEAVRSVQLVRQLPAETDALLFTHGKSTPSQGHSATSTGQTVQTTPSAPSTQSDTTQATFDLTKDPLPGSSQRSRIDGGQEPRIAVLSLEKNDIKAPMSWPSQLDKAAVQGPRAELILIHGGYVIRSFHIASLEADGRNHQLRDRRFWSYVGQFAQPFHFAFTRNQLPPTIHVASRLVELNHNSFREAFFLRPNGTSFQNNEAGRFPFSELKRLLSAASADMRRLGIICMINPIDARIPSRKQRYNPPAEIMVALRAQSDACLIDQQYVGIANVSNVSAQPRSIVQTDAKLPTMNPRALPRPFTSDAGVSAFRAQNALSSRPPASDIIEITDSEEEEDKALARSGKSSIKMPAPAGANKQSAKLELIDLTLDDDDEPISEFSAPDSGDVLLSNELGGSLAIPEVPSEVERVGGPEEPNGDLANTFSLDIEMVPPRTPSSGPSSPQPSVDGEDQPPESTSDTTAALKKATVVTVPMSENDETNLTAKGSDRAMEADVSGLYPLNAGAARFEVGGDLWHQPPSIPQSPENIRMRALEPTADDGGDLIDSTMHYPSPLGIPSELRPGSLDTRQSDSDIERDPMKGMELDAEYERLQSLCTQWACTMAQFMEPEVAIRYLQKAAQYQGEDLDSSFCDQMRALPKEYQAATYNRSVFESWIMQSCSEEPDAPPISVQNDVDDSPCPPWDFVYTNRLIRGNGVPRKRPLTEKDGCSCLGGCSRDPAACSCAQNNMHFPKDRNINIDGFLYDPEGRINDFRWPVFECNEACSCAAYCNNRVAQYGRRHAVEIKKTLDRGWGVFASEDIPKGTFLGVYGGEILDDTEAEVRGRELYNLYDRNYLFDIDCWYLKPYAAMKGQKHVIYSIDAMHAGSFTRFLNHSCDPNCYIVPCVFGEAQPEIPYLAFFTLEAVLAGVELTFSYSGLDEAMLDEKSRNAARIRADAKRRLGKHKPKADTMTVDVPCACGSLLCKGSIWNLGAESEESSDDSEAPSEATDA